MNLQRMTRWRWGAGALISAIALLVACDGDNLFNNKIATSVSAIPVITSVTGPDVVKSGSVVDIRVVAHGTSPIASLTVRFRGATTEDVTVTIATPTNDVTRDVSVTLPVAVSDTILTVTAVATDNLGQLSALTAASTKVIRVQDTSAPAVTVSVDKATANAGSRIAITVNATDNVGLTKIGFALVNPAGDTVGGAPTLVNTAGLVKDTTFSFLLPSTLTPRTVRVLGIGVDATGRRGFSSSVNVSVADSAAPTITFLAPGKGSTLPLNDSVRVQVRVRDASGIKSIKLIGQSIRVDSLGPTRTIVRFVEKDIDFPAIPGGRLPTDTTITRYLNATVDSISENVSIIAIATDSLNNTSSDSVTILVGGPRVELRNPTTGAQVTPGGTLLLTAFVTDRSAGVDSVRFDITGAQQATFTFRNGCTSAICQPNGLVSNDSVLISQNYVVGPTPGTVTITATAWNRNRVAGVSSPVTVLVTTNVSADALPPQVRMSLESNDRVELSDTVVVTLAAQDQGAAGLRRMGIVVTTTPGGTGVAPATLVRDSIFTGSGRTGLQPATFKFTLADLGYNELNLVALPRNMTLNIHAFAVDTVGNAGCNTTSTLAALPCDSLTLAGKKWFITKNVPGASQLVTVVPGFARALQQGSRIADILVDNTPARPRMFLSNQNNNRIDVLELVDSTLDVSKSISVGSEPWGLFTNNANTRLIVANSGGTNISFVNTLGAPHTALKEEPGERLLTPNEVLYNITFTTSNGFLRFTTNALDFSDRPQFVAQDANGIIMYSTKPTAAAADGTVRFLTTHPVTANTRPDSKILFNRDAIASGVDGIAIAYIDSIVVIRPGLGNDAIELFDHVPGSPKTLLRSGIFENVDTAISTLRATGSDIFASAGGWIRSNVGLSDTTYIAASTNRQFVAFGEGGVGPFARIWVWRCGPLTAACSIGAPPPATQGAISDNVTVQDLVGNASERVVGLSLNNDGQIGAARGGLAAYFFSNNAQLEGDLRLQGVFSNGVAGGGGGVALHPNNITPPPGATDLQACSETQLAFIATANRSIKIVDTFHYRERGEVLIRDNIVGPLRAAVPLAGDNTGTLGSKDEILVKLYGVTSAGKAVIINVRRRDLTGFNADRTCQ